MGHRDVDIDAIRLLPHFGRQAKHQNQTLAGDWPTESLGAKDCRCVGQRNCDSPQKIFLVGQRLGRFSLFEFCCVSFVRLRGDGQQALESAKIHCVQVFSVSFSFLRFQVHRYLSKPWIVNNVAKRLDTKMSFTNMFVAIDTAP